MSEVVNESSADEALRSGKDAHRHVVTRALQTEEQNNELFLQRFAARLNRVQVDPPAVHLRFRNVSASSVIEVGDRAVPTLLNAVTGLASSLLVYLRLAKTSKQSFGILKDVSGIVRPGRIALILGPPAGGKSTLLQLLAGLLGSGSALKVQGEISYNGETLDRFYPERTAAYVPQDDVHIAKLQVQETLDFAARCQGKGILPALQSLLRQREGDGQVDRDADLDAWMQARVQEGTRNSVAAELVMRLLGLEECRETLVGDNVVRGISGGQKKRVTTGDLLVGPSQVLLMDEITTGLDASNAAVIVQCFRHLAHLQRATVLMALLQPSPEIFELFDDVMLLAEGRLVYSGPREELAPFFSWVGLRCPERKNVADFVQEICSEKDQEQYWAGPDDEYAFIPVRELAEAFTQTETHRHNMRELEAPYQPPANCSPELNPLTRSKYALSNWESFKVCMWREVIIMKRNSFVYIFRVVQVAILTIIAATLLIRPVVPPNSLQIGQLFVGMPFGLLVGLMMDNFSEMAILVETQPVFFRQRARRYYPAWIWPLPTSLLRIPYSLVLATSCTAILYWVMGFDSDAGRYFAFTFLFFLAHQFALSLFRTIAAINRSLVLAYPFAWLMFLTILLLGGYILNKRDVHVWDIGGYWALPLQWIQNALAINEFSADRWKKPNPALPGSGQDLSTTILENYDFRHSRLWVWLAFAVVGGWVVLLNLLLVLASQFVPAPQRKPGTMPRAALEARQIADVGYPGGEENDSMHEPSIRANGAAQGDGAAPNEHDPDQPSDRTASKHCSPPDGQSSMDPIDVKHQSPAGHARPSTDGAAQRSSQDNAAGQRLSMESNYSISRASQQSWRRSQRKRSRKAQGMILPFEPLSFTFDHISYSVPASGDAEDPRNQKDEQGRMQLLLLDDVSGAFRPGVLTCLMGASGAGKTTLMDCLAGRKTAGRVRGEMLVNGHPKNQETFARVSGYVEQFDVHAAGATVYEAVLFSARMRLMNAEDKLMDFVEEVVELTELTPMKEALVGEPGASGLSTEQRKRLTIAVELVANPSILFLDEPTSGLDARAAAVVMRVIRNTVNTGRTVLGTIHQPAEEIFFSFDELLLLKRGGRVIFFGELGSQAQCLIDYFQGIKGVQRMQERQNPSTWMLQVSRAPEERRLGIDFGEAYQSSDLHRRAGKLIERCRQPAEGSRPLHFDKPYARSWQQQLSLLLQRNAREYWRMPEYNTIRMFFTVAFGFVLGSIYWRIGTQRNSTTGIANLAGALLVANIFLGTSNASTVQPVVAAQRAVMYRERAAGYYAIYPFALAQALVELPYVGVQTLLYSLITYFMTYFYIDAAKFFWYLLFSFLTLMYFTYWGMTAVALTPNTQVSAVLSSGFYTLWFIFAGFIVPRPEMKCWWCWYYYLDPLSYTVWGLVGSQLSDVNDVSVTASDGQQISVRIYMENFYQLYHGFLGFAVLILFAFIILFHVVTAFALIKLNYLKR